MPRYPRPEGFGPRGARDDRVGETLHDSDEEVEVRDRSPSPEWRPPTREYTVPPAPPSSLEDVPKKRPGTGKTEEQLAETAARVEDWVADVEIADTRSSEDGRRQRLMRKARAVLLEFFRKK
ncbi:uncharacterized protein LAJ45_07253 [Morchella importuna]|uniref:Uncharacterized protein n=1 Tax=Morchella conica CCBAS932 TaxID=1392247 RepID=A0A3N4L380_9PEZI|nr:uncharacterized protein LAJ45_07253 [Morchella importuna]KAH8148542.1 hypothetical protein LAJ45_07253 [Morchella importuna]RPB15081.1 hypothetical protein P167DRAFT_603728 [Morchella conica CCBAS932]